MQLNNIYLNTDRDGVQNGRSVDQMPQVKAHLAAAQNASWWNMRIFFFFERPCGRRWVEGSLGDETHYFVQVLPRRKTVVKVVRIDRAVRMDQAHLSYLKIMHSALLEFFQPEKIGQRKS